MTTLETALLKLQQYLYFSQHDKTVEVLHALLEYAPTQYGREYVAVEIASCRDDDALRQLSRRYLTGLLVPMRAQGGRTPPISDHPSRPSAATNESNMQYLIETAKRDQKVLKDLCLRRDDFRCVISGNVDFLSCKTGNVQCPDNKHQEGTIAAHIIPFSVAAKDETPAVVQKTSAIFEILNRFGGVRLHELNGSNIDRVENVFTLSVSIHYLFGMLAIWLDAVDGETHTYRLRHGSTGASQVPDGTLVTFRSAIQDAPLPDPRYIAIHAACAKVLHASGAAEVVDQYLKDYEEVKVLAEDGSSSQFLDTALRMISVS
ncbi:hypothetical protein K439DRAFT_664045 [Ramaria rubella]|nr:hypothetical protein K439DRAFT_664045 [Ramaria rubella]